MLHDLQGNHAGGWVNHIKTDFDDRLATMVLNLLMVNPCEISTQQWKAN